MKRFISYILIFVLALNILPVAAMAAVPSISIDNANVYEGMNKAYNQGYLPAVKNGVATIILPLLANSQITGDKINVRPDLGDTANSPFVFLNYEKTVSLANNTVNGGGSTISSYLVEFDFTLSNNRVNGTYPVTFEVSGETPNGDFKQSFTSYVIITDGKNPDSTPAPVSEPIQANITIDNVHRYEGMAESYSQGYVPTVKNGVATIILPLLCDGSLYNNQLTITPDLGDAASAPFVFKNYGQTVSGQYNKIESFSPKYSYLVHLELTLKQNPNNGNYPVVISVEGRNISGTVFRQSFTVYVHITDGKAPGIPEPDSLHPNITIDGQSRYEGMALSYSQGYMPVVKNGAATIIMPLLCEGKLYSNQLTVTANLGAPSVSPFVFKNYEQTVKGGYNKTDGSSKKYSYLVHLNLDLEANRVNGTYPVEVSAEGRDAQGTVFRQTFTVYVTITDGMDSGASVWFSIDNKNKYKGMNKPYDEGYLPEVSGGSVSVILPLLSAGPVKNNSITINSDLGPPASSPFIYKNYNKTVALGMQTLSSGGKEEAYLVQLKLELSPDRINGTYPVVINIEAQTSGGERITQAFTAYVTVSDGKDGNSQTADTPQSQPKLMISNYSVNPAPVLAGKEFSTAVTILNTNEAQAVKNIKVTVSSTSADFILENESNTFYFKAIAPGGTIVLNLDYQVYANAPAAPQKLNFAMEYEDAKAMPMTAEGEITVQIKQAARIEAEAPAIPEKVHAGETLSVSMNVLNLGKDKLYNVRFKLEAPGMNQAGVAFIGNMEAGTSMTGLMDVDIQSKKSENAAGGTEEYGRTQGNITLIYEDSSGTEETQEIPFSTIILEPVTPAGKQQKEKAGAGQWIGSVIGLGAIIGVIFSVRFFRKKGRGKHDESI